MKMSALKVNQKTRRAIALTLALALPFSINLNAKEIDVKSQKDEDIEVIDVLGSKPLSYYRDQMKIAESSFYDMYNGLVDKEEFKIKCRNEKATGSHIRRKVCYPQYVLSEMSRLTQLAFNPSILEKRHLVSPFPTVAGVRDIVTQERNESENYIKNLLVENPDLYKSYMKLKKSVEIYKQKKSDDS